MAKQPGFCHLPFAIQDAFVSILHQAGIFSGLLDPSAP
jgi:hypothetical protein